MDTIIKLYDTKVPFSSVKIGEPFIYCTDSLDDVSKIVEKKYI
jgi:hypothetical protein